MPLPLAGERLVLRAASSAPSSPSCAPSALSTVRHASSLSSSSARDVASASANELGLVGCGGGGVCVGDRLREAGGKGGLAVGRNGDEARVFVAVGVWDHACEVGV